MELLGNINLAESRGLLEGYANPEKISVQDGVDYKYKDKRLSLWKARYSYAPKSNSKNSRDFCIKMVNIAKSGIVYRKEDIVKMGDDGVHSELAAKGKTSYSIWLYKGGALCGHYWQRHIYVRKWNAINIPSWINMLVDLPIPVLNNKWAQAISFLIVSSTGLSLNDRKNMFANIIDFKSFVESSSRGYFQRYITGLNMPASFKTILFQRYGKTTNTLITYFKGLIRGRPFPMDKISNKLPSYPALLDFQDSGKLFDDLSSVLKDYTRGNDRKIGIPKKRSRTRKLENDEEINVREARKRAIKYPVNDMKVNTKPRDMVNRGYMPTRTQRFVSGVSRAADFIRKYK